MEEKREKLNFLYLYYYSISILLFKGLLLFRVLIFQFKNAPISLCLSRDKTKEQSGKNATLKHCLKNRTTLLLIFKLIYSLINQIFKIKIIHVYIYIYIINKNTIFSSYKIRPLTKKKKYSLHAQSTCDEANLYYYLRGFPVWISHFFSQKMSLHLYV